MIQQKHNSNKRVSAETFQLTEKAQQYISALYPQKPSNPSSPSLPRHKIDGIVVMNAIEEINNRISNIEKILQEIVPSSRKTRSKKN